MKTLPIFAAIAALMLGGFLVVGPEGDAHEAFAVVGILLMAGGVTYLWKQTGFRGLKPK